MRLLSLLFTIHLILSCSNNDGIHKNEFIKREIELIDQETKIPFAKVTVLIPKHFDTLQIWTDYSDTECSHLNKYRFTNTRNCLIKESGFSHLDKCKDSINWFEITHSCKGQLTSNFSIESLNEYIKAKNRLWKFTVQPPIIWKSAALKLINGKKFKIIETSMFECDYEFEIHDIGACTVFNNTRVCFGLKCRQKDCSKFTHYSNKILNSIKINSIME